MKTSACTIAILLAGAFLCFSAELNAFQLKNSYLVEESEPDDSLSVKVSTGFGFSLAGPTMFTRFQLIDELGMEQDVMSLLLDDLIRRSVGVSENQYKEMASHHSKVTSQLSGELAGVIASGNGEKVLKDRYLQMQDELRSMLTPDQLNSLERAKFNKGVKEFGVAKYLGSTLIRNAVGLSERQINSLDELQGSFKAKLANETELLIEHANELLTKNLSDEQRSQLDSMISPSALQAFKAGKLFSDETMQKNKIMANKSALLSLLRNKKIKKKLGVSEEQTSRLADLRKQVRNKSVEQFKSELEGILSSKQVNQLYEYGILAEAKKAGTVNALAYGLLSEKIELSMEQSETLFEAGKTIAKDLLGEMHDLKAAILMDSLGTLDAGQRERLAELMGTSVSR